MIKRAMQCITIADLPYFMRLDMAFFEMNALWRAWYPFADRTKNSHRPRRRVDRLPKDLTDKIAKDIGLTQHQLDVLRFEMPSQKPNSRSI